MRQFSTLPRTLPALFFRFLKPYTWYLAGMVLVSLLYGVHSILLPFTLKILVDRISISHVATPGLFAALKWPAIGYVALSLGLGLLFRFYNFLMLRLLPNLKRDVQHAMFVQLEGHSHSYFQNQFAGALSNKVSDMVRGVSEILQMFMSCCVDPVLSISVAIFAMSRVHPLFALIFGVFSVVFISLSWTLAQYCQPLASAYSEARSTTVGKVVDSITNMMNVRLFARHEFENRYLGRYINDVVAKDRRMQRYLIFARLALVLCITTMLAFMIWALIWAKSEALITAGDFVLILTLTHRILDMLWGVTNQFVQFSQEIGTCKQALTIITQPHEIEDHVDATRLQAQQGQIQFQGVGFSYGNVGVFEGLDLTIAGGSKVGLVGFSGSGKSTFVNLILRFFEVQSGQILIDGQDISRVTQTSLHEQISMIPQDTSLFHRSLLENIRYGRLDASDEYVIAAAKQAHCHDFILKIPGQYEALVGERGIKLSGGQRQRIAIARAILKNSPILILDEATSSLDSVTEAHIQSSLHDLMQNRTTIVIAHRLSTLSSMDRLLVFDQGKIVQDGTHDQLIIAPGQYQKLWSLQANGFLPG